MSAKWLSLTTTNRDFTLRQVKMAEALIMKRKQMVEAFKKNVAGAIVCDKCLQPPGRSLPLIFCIHVRSGPIYWEGYLPCKKDYKVMVFYM
jgi:hypothetical protein